MWILKILNKFAKHSGEYRTRIFKTIAFRFLILKADFQIIGLNLKTTQPKYSNKFLYFSKIKFSKLAISNKIKSKLD